MQHLRRHHFGIETLFIVTGVALCIATGVIMAFVRIPSALTLGAAFGVLVLALAVVLGITTTLLGEDD